MGNDRKAYLYEAAKLIESLAASETVNATTKQSTLSLAKILRKEARFPGIIQEWVADEHPTWGIIGGGSRKLEADLTEDLFTLPNKCPICGALMIWTIASSTAGFHWAGRCSHPKTTGCPRMA